MEPLAIDWRGIFVPAFGLLEIFVSGTIMYLAMFVILRRPPASRHLRSCRPAGDRAYRRCGAERFHGFGEGQCP